jgi:hypothetical protein
LSSNLLPFFEMGLAFVADASGIDLLTLYLDMRVKSVLTLHNEANQTCPFMYRLFDSIHIIQPCSDALYHIQSTL